MSRRVSWEARASGIHLTGSSEVGPKDVTAVTAVARDLEQLLSSKLVAIGFSGAPSEGKRAYSARFAPHGSVPFGVVFTVSPV